MRLSVDLTDAQQQHLAAAALRDLFARSDADFETAAARVLEKNAELYRRLA